MCKFRSRLYVLADGWATRWELQGTHCRVRNGTAGYAPLAAGYAAIYLSCRVRTGYCRVRSGLLELQGTHRSTWDAEYRPAGPRGGFHAGLPAVSRFLNFPIVYRGKSFRTWTSNPTPRAILCIDPGGYVRGAERPGAAAASPLGGPLGTCLGGMSGCGWAPLQAWLRAPGSPRGHGVFESLAFLGFWS